MVLIAWFEIHPNLKFPFHCSGINERSFYGNTFPGKLTLENHKIWNLYVLEKGRFVLIGSCESEVSSSCKGGQLRLNAAILKLE